MQCVCLFIHVNTYLCAHTCTQIWNESIYAPHFVMSLGGKQFSLICVGNVVICGLTCDQHLGSSWVRDSFYLQGITEGSLHRDLTGCGCKMRTKMQITESGCLKGGTNYSQSSLSSSSASLDQPTRDRKSSKEKLCLHWTYTVFILLFCEPYCKSYLVIINIVSGITNALEVISVHRRMCVGYMQLWCYFV
jgi:hypothetical protein